MISVDTMEVLLRSIPQYFLFGALAFFIFSWMNKKPLYGLIGEAILVVVAIIMLIVVLSGYIPSPKTQGMNEEHLKLVIKMAMFFMVIGLLSAISLLIRWIRKKQFVPLIVAIFVLCIILFFNSTRLSKIKFELNRPTTTVIDSGK
jgi:fatty acid desaturase